MANGYEGEQEATKRKRVKRLTTKISVYDCRYGWQLVGDLGIFMTVNEEGVRPDLNVCQYSDLNATVD